MCRLLLTFICEVKIIFDFLFQSINKKYTPGLNNYRDFNYHKDGFGISLLENNKWKNYKSEVLFLYDTNYQKFLENIKNCQVVIGHIRSIKDKEEISYENTHPFKFNHDNWCHNGSVYPLDREFLLKFINKKYYSNIKGTTDSEILFYIFLTLKKKYYIIDAWKKLFELFNQFYSRKNIVISGNIIFYNTKIILVSRYINNNEEPPSLYLDLKNLTISSEPINNYIILPKNTYVKIDISTKNFSVNKF